MSIPSAPNSIMMPAGEPHGTPDSAPLTPLGTHGVNELWIQLRHGRRVLLKGLRDDLRDDLRYRMMLRKEFDITTRLDHPNIVRTVGIETVTGVGECIVMEYIDGVTLGQWLNTHPDLKAGQQILAELTDALAYAASLGISHRDLKPDNIMVTRTGNHVRIIDYGLGDSDDFITLKQSAGTPRYGSPEQQSGEPCDGLKADVYALGAIMSDMSLPRRYRSIISACMRREPHRRPDMSAVAKLVAGAARRRPLRIVTIIAAALIMFTGAIIYVLYNRDRTVGDRVNDAAQPDTLPQTPSQPIHVDTPEAPTRPVEAPKPAPASTYGTDSAYNDAIARLSALVAAYDCSPIDRNIPGDFETKFAAANKLREDAEAVIHEFKTEALDAGADAADIDARASALLLRYVEMLNSHMQQQTARHH